MLAPHLGLDSGQQLTCAEGLGYIIISAQLKTQHLVNLPVLSCEHDDGNIQMC
ncbi:hypothetical protein D3C81_2213560 [compost metagenome]